MINKTFTTKRSDYVLVENKFKITPLEEGKGSYVARAVETESFLRREIILENCEFHELGIIGKLKTSHDGVTETSNTLRKKGYQKIEEVPIGPPGGDMGWFPIEGEGWGERVHQAQKVVINIYGVFALI
jgi:hypothetical protein